MLSLLHDVARVRKRRAHRARRIDVRVAAGVIEVEVGIDDELHVRRAVPRGGDRVLEVRAGDALIVQRAAVLQAVDLVELRALLVARAGVDENEAVVMLDQQAAHAEWNAVPVVGRDALLPEWLGDDAEHRAAVELLAAGLEGMDAESTDFSRLDERRRRGHSVFSGYAVHGLGMRNL